MWEAFGLRAAAYAYYGGADLGECLTTVERVGDNGTPDLWHREWSATADRLREIAVQCEHRGHKVSAREAYFRTASYYHVAYFPLFGSPVDPRLRVSFGSEETVFRSAARLCDPEVEPVEIPFESGSLPGYFLRAPGPPRPRPTIIHVNGYDSNIQEMYFAHGPAAQRRGYNCLLFDGPGQGRNLIRDGMSQRPDWETVVAAVVDFALCRPDVDPRRLVLSGWSFGGFLAPRAAAFEKRIAALVADPGQWDQSEGLKAFGLSAEDLANLDRVDPVVFDTVEKRLRSPQADPLMRWRILQRGFWVHGVDSLYGLVREMARFRISGVAGNINCPTLIATAEGDPLAKGAQKLYDALRCPKTLVRFTATEGAAGHCESLARSLYHQRVFDWLDEALLAE